MIVNLATSLLEHERVITTPAKAKLVRPFVERLVTYSKGNTLADRRKVLALLRHKKLMGVNAKGERVPMKAMKKLFTELGPRYEGRNGGYTRILRLGGSRRGDSPVELKYRTGKQSRRLKLSGNRLGDDAEQVILEFVTPESASASGQEEARGS